MRCFISIELPENVKAHIFHSFEKLKNSKLCQGNFTKKNNLQLTLKFFSKLSEDQIKQIKKVLEKIDFRQFPIETGKIGFFPNEKFVKSIWIELIASDFQFLKEELDRELSKIGFKEEEKKFIPRITVAKIRGMKNKQAFLDKVQEVSPKKMFFIADQIFFIKSILKKRGPEPKILSSFPMRRRV